MAEQIRLVGSFQDNISPKLKKLNANIDKLTKSFTRMGREASKATKVAVRPMKQLNVQMRNSTRQVDRSSKSWDRYTRSVRNASRAARGFRGPKPGMAPSGGGMGGGGGLGFFGAAAAGFTGNIATIGLYAAVQGLRGAVGTFVAQGRQAETDFLMMANTLSTLGNVDFETAKDLSESTIADLVKTAQALPGSTKEFIQIAQQVMDESIVGFGSMEAALADISKGADSFVGRFGLLAQAAGIDSAVAAGDIAQLAANPNASQRQISLFKYNPALFKAYQENLAKFNGDYFKALNEAMKEVVSPELVDNLRNTFSTSMEEFATAFGDPYVGVFGALRKVSITMADGTTQVVTTMDSLGRAMRQVNDLIATIFGMNLTADPLVSLNNFLYEVGYTVFKLNQDLKHMMTGALNLGDVLGSFGSDIGGWLGQLTAQLINFITGLDYAAMASGLNDAIFSFFTELFRGIDYGQIGEMALNLIQGMFGSLAGFIIGSAVIAKFLAVFGGIGATIAGFAGIIGPIIAGIGTFLTGTLLPAFSAVATFIMGTVVPAIAAVAAPVLAVVGAVLLVIAVVRNFGNIVKLVGAGLKWLWANIKKGWLTLLTSLMKGIQGLLNKVGLGWILDGPLEEAQKHLTNANEEAEQATKDMTDAVNGIKDQTVKDFNAIGDAVNNLIPKFENTADVLDNLPKDISPGAREAIEGGTASANTPEGRAAGMEWYQQQVAAGKVPGVSAPATPAAPNANQQATKQVSANVTKVDTSVKKVSDHIKTVIADMGTHATAHGTKLDAINTSVKELKANGVQKVSVVGEILARVVNLPATTASNAYTGSTPLGQAVATEQRHMPSGAHLVIANSSETVIPAYKGHSPGGGGATTINMGAPQITVVAGDRNGRELADEIAGYFMEAIAESTHNEVFTS